MTEKTMTLSEALSLKKSLKRKIDKRLQKIKLSYLPVSTREVAEHEDYYKMFSAEIQSVYQSLTVIKTNYNILSCAINTANAKTKTDMINEITGDPYTISDLLIMLSDSVADDMLKAIDDGYCKARAKQAGRKDMAIIDPLGNKIRDQLSSTNEDFKEKAKLAIQKANVKKKIKISFVD